MHSPRFDRYCSLPTPIADFRMYDSGEKELLLITLGDIHDLGPRPLLRVHSSCLASEVFGALDCDCADQLRESMRRIAEEGLGLIVHLDQEGRGQGLSKKIAATGLMQEQGLDTCEAFELLGLAQDVRDYDVVCRTLRMLGIRAVRLISNNPCKRDALVKGGITVEEVHTHPILRPENERYLETKASKLEHALHYDASPSDTDPIQFYHSDGVYGALSNFSRHAVYAAGRVWPTAEHCYQALKFSGTEREEQIRRAPSPTKAKLLASEWRSWRRPVWNRVKDAVMLEVLRAKFTQHPDLEKMLLETGNRDLVKHTASDLYWGDGGDGSGKNRLGALLMEVRLEIRRSRQVGRGIG